MEIQGDVPCLVRLPCSLFSLESHFEGICQELEPPRTTKYVHDVEEPRGALQQEAFGLSHNQRTPLQTSYGEHLVAWVHVSRAEGCPMTLFLFWGKQKGFLHGQSPRWAPCAAGTCPQGPPRAASSGKLTKGAPGSCRDDLTTG